MQKKLSNVNFFCQLAVNLSKSKMPSKLASAYLLGVKLMGFLSSLNFYLVSELDKQ